MRADYTDAQFEPETLISTHMDLVKRIAWHLHGRVHSAIEIDDLLQIGYVGLITAAQKYSKQEGVAFASYASLRIRGAMVDHLRKSSNLCRTTIQMRKRFTASEEKLTRKLNRTPHHDEIAADMNITIEELTEWQHAFAANVHDSLEGVYDDFSVLFATPATVRRNRFPTRTCAISLRKRSHLPEREALVIQLFYVEELNVYEIAEILEVSSGRVSQIKKSAVTRLRNFIQENFEQDIQA